MSRAAKTWASQGWTDVALDLDWMRHSQEGGILGLQEMDGAEFFKKQVKPATDKEAIGKKKKGDKQKSTPEPGKKAKRAEDVVSAQLDPDEAPIKRRKKQQAVEAAADAAPHSRPGAAAAQEIELTSVAIKAHKPSKLGAMDADKAAKHRAKLQLRRERMRAKKREEREARRAAEEQQVAANGAGAGGQPNLPKPSKQEKAAARALADGAADAQDMSAPLPVVAGAEAKKRKRKKPDGEQAAGGAAAGGDAAEVGAAGAPPATPCNVDAWEPLGLHADILAALSRVGFSAPTPIQAACVPAALLRGKDVIGAAETGSGKTLAFGLPIMHFLLEEAHKAGGPASAPPRYAPAALCLLPTRELALQVEQHLSVLLPRAPAFRVVSLVGGMAVPKQRRMLARRPAVVVATPGRLWALLSQYSDEYLSRLHHLRFLVLDEADRMVAPGHFAELGAILDAVEAAEPAFEGGSELPPPDSGGEGDFGGLGGDSAANGGRGARRRAVGGMAEEEEEEEAEGSEDEENGDSSAAAHAAPRAHEIEPPRGGRQTFLFSATLTLPAEMRRKGGRLPATVGTSARGKGKAKDGKGRKGGGAHAGGANGAAAAAGGAGALAGSEDNPAMVRLVEKLIFQNEIEVVDLSRQALTVENLQQRKLSCLPEDKEATLWALIRSLRPGRGIVFANSIATVRRLGALLPLLEVPTITLHASMQQRQRLQHLDKFKRTEGGVLLATDVAARGLDIAGLDYVIHFHMPYTVEAYVHRSGRTARARAHGVCIALVDPGDEKRYRMICHALSPESAAGFAPYDGLGSVADVMPRVHRAISLAMKLDADLHDARKKRASSDWLERAAHEMELELDDDLREEVEQNRGTAVSKREQAQVREELRRLLQNINRPTAAQRAAAPHGIPLPAAHTRR